MLCMSDIIILLTCITHLSHLKKTEQVETLCAIIYFLTIRQNLDYCHFYYSSISTCIYSGLE